MTAEKEFKRDNGDAVKIITTLHASRYDNCCDWRVNVYIKLSDKHVFAELHHDFDDFDMDSYWHIKSEKMLNYVTLSEITEVKHLLMDKIRETITDKVD